MDWEHGDWSGLYNPETTGRETTRTTSGGGTSAVGLPVRTTRMVVDEKGSRSVQPPAQPEEGVFPLRRRRPALALIAERDRVEQPVQSRRELEYIAWTRRIIDETTTLPGSLALLTASTTLLWFRMCDVGALWALSTTCRALRGRASAFGTASLVEVAAALACRDAYKSLRPALPSEHHVPFGSALLPLTRGASARPSWLARLRCLSRGAAVAVGAYADKSGVAVAATEIVDGGLVELSRRPLSGPVAATKALDVCCVSYRGALLVVQRLHDPLMDSGGGGDDRVRQGGAQGGAQEQQQPNAAGGANNNNNNNNNNREGGQQQQSRTEGGRRRGDRRRMHRAGSWDDDPPLSTSDGAGSRECTRRLSGRDAVRWDPSTARWHVAPLWRGDAPGRKCAALQATNFRRAVCVDALGRLIIASSDCRRVGADRRQHRPRPPFHPDRDEFDCRPWRFARRHTFAAGPEEDLVDDDRDVVMRDVRYRGARGPAVGASSSASSSPPRDADDDDRSDENDDADENDDDAEGDDGDLDDDADAWTELPALSPWRETATVDVVAVQFRPPIAWDPRPESVDLFADRRPENGGDAAPACARLSSEDCSAADRETRAGYRHQACAWLTRRQRLENHRRSRRRAADLDEYDRYSPRVCLTHENDDRDDHESLLVAVTSDGKTSADVSVSVYVLDELMGAWILAGVAPTTFRGWAVSAAASGNQVLVASTLDNALSLNLEDLSWRTCRVRQRCRGYSPRPDVPASPCRPGVPDPHCSAVPRHHVHALPAAAAVNPGGIMALPRLQLVAGPSPDAAAAVVLTAHEAAVYDVKRDPRTRRAYFQLTASAPVASSFADLKRDSPPLWAAVLLPLPL